MVMFVLLQIVCFGAADALLRMPSGVADRPKTYSNPLGTSLTQIKENVWLAERPFYPRLPGLQGVDVACKAAVVRLKDGSLWVHAPVELDTGTRKAVEALGEVRHIVSPNAEHVSFAAKWLSEYPLAESYCSPFLKKRFPHIPWKHEITKAPASWGNEFEMLWIDCETVPLLGRGEPFFSELVFCHKPSKVLFVTDLWWNYPQKGPGWWKTAMDQVYRPVYNNVLRRRPRHDALMRTMLSWDFDYVAPCHGEPIDRQVKQTLLRFFNLEDEQEEAEDL